MNTLIRLILKVLRGNVQYNNTTVPVIFRQYPIDKTPCITLDDSGGSVLDQVYHKNIKMILPTTHPQYSPTVKKPQECMIEKRHATININVWCNSESERDVIDTQIKNLFNMAINHHYSFCANFTKGTNICSTTNVKCAAIDDLKSKGIKNKCPDTSTYKYKSVYEQFNIEVGSINVSPAFVLNDLSVTNPILQGVLRLTASYEDIYVIGGIESQTLHFNGEIENG